MVYFNRVLNPYLKFNLNLNLIAVLCCDKRPVEKSDLPAVRFIFDTLCILIYEDLEIHTFKNVNK